MNFLKVLGDPQWWRALLGSDFNRGFMAALALILVLMVFLMLIRAIIHLIFGTRRCSSVVVRRADGPETPPSSRAEGLLFLHGLESNPGSSLQTEESADIPTKAWRGNVFPPARGSCRRLSRGRG